MYLLILLISINPGTQCNLLWYQYFLVSRRHSYTGSFNHQFSVWVKRSKAKPTVQILVTNVYFLNWLPCVWKLHLNCHSLEVSWSLFFFIVDQMNSELNLAKNLLNWNCSRIHYDYTPEQSSKIIKSICQPEVDEKVQQRWKMAAPEIAECLEQSGKTLHAKGGKQGKYNLIMRAHHEDNLAQKIKISVMSVH